MQTGQVFKIDAQAVKEMATFYKRPESDFDQLNGREFSIAKSKTVQSVTDTEVRGTKWEDGKPQRGRPRKFPRSTVARLLGETDDPSLQASASDDSSDSSDSADSSAQDSATAEASEAENLDDAAEELIAATAPAASEASDDSGDDDSGW